MMTCACSAGPAFEGGDISCGMRATDGAIGGRHHRLRHHGAHLHIVRRGGPEARGPVRLGHHRHDRGTVPLRHHQRQGSLRPEGSRVQRDQHGTGRYILATPAESANRPGNLPDRSGHRELHPGQGRHLLRHRHAPLLHGYGRLGAGTRVRGRRHRQRHQYEKRHLHRYVPGGGAFPSTNMWATPPWPVPMPWPSPIRRPKRWRSWPGT